MPTPTRGAFIVFEGLDRCGKSTQVDHLVQRLERQGCRARLQKFPGTGCLDCLVTELIFQGQIEQRK